MALNAAQFDRHLASAELKPAYLLAGDEHLLVLEAADALRAKARAQGYIERVVLESAESGFEWHELANAGAAMSLFATRRLIDLRIPTGKPGKEGSEAIVAYCAAPPPDTILLVTAQTWSKQHDTAWSAAIEDVGVAATFWPLKGNELPAWIAARAGKRGVELAGEAVEVLAERMEGNLLAAAQEIDKLALLAGAGGGTPRRVDAETLEQIVSDSARFDVFQLVDAALAGDSARALRIAAALRAEGEAVPALLGWFTMQLNLALRCAVAMEQGASLDAAMRNERVWPQARLGIFRAALGRARANYWEAMLAQAAHVERVGKGRAAGDAWRELERLLAMVAQPRAAKSLAVAR
ncbi:MAG TPA: DNA polymerase III subunit delta [Xanthomonadales bacterium]|nr:DNA polymerase III subunit delta [Xanthomonadales bacterium]